FDYNEVITMSILFYEAQRSGKLPQNNRIPWRGDSGLRDGCDVGVDLTGGWYDAGDQVKFGFPMAYSVTVLAWGVIEFKDAYVDANQYNHVLNSLKWVADYFVKAHTSRYELYGQVGSGITDHLFWGRPEDMQMHRPSFKINAQNPGTELAAETAAALAACAIIFKQSRPGYSRMLLQHATQLYEFADRYRGSYHLSIPDVASFYRSYSGYNDELVWGALWLHRATGARSYLEDAKRKYQQYGQGNTPKLFSWDDKRAGSQVLLANFTGEAKYKGHVANYQQFLSGGGAVKTPKGLVWLDQWGSNRYAANAAFIALAAARVPGIANREQMIRFAQSQIHYMLGASGRSYVVGYGNNSPTQPHHGSSSCPTPPTECSWNTYHSSGPNHYTLYGALVGGPSRTDSYTDHRGDYVSNEVAVDYNAGFQGAVAGWFERLY
uniref:Endoglucanase n=1 Tax=Ciona savignyi TaxID=51511 RepID=H2YUQ7_CIOSA